MKAINEQITSAYDRMPIEITDLVAYVDGSYDQSTQCFSYGMVILENGEEKAFNKSFFSDSSLRSMRNVAGEIMGARAAIEYAIKNNKKRLIIRYDYDGIANWPLGKWSANKEATKSYVKFVREAAQKVQITFEKIKAHSGDKYNDYADKLAKQALELVK